MLFRSESSDFVSFDPEQKRIRDELLIDGCVYRITRGEFESGNEVSFNFYEATTALACASCDIAIVVQLKREIGKLWESTEKGYYKQLYNPSVSGRFVFNCVMTQMFIDRALKSKENELEVGRDQGIVIHGNRFIAMQIFEQLDLGSYKSKTYNFDNTELGTRMKAKVDYHFNQLKAIIDESYDNSILSTLFKNSKKCKEISAILKN